MGVGLPLAAARLADMLDRAQGLRRPDVLSWIGEYRPDAVLAGHVHQAAFTEAGSWADRIGDTWVFNAGTQIGKVPARVELDLDAGRARWVSIMGQETCQLTDAGPPARTVF